MKNSRERGFTLVELVAAAGAFLVALATTALLLTPKTYDTENRNAERRLDTAAIAQALARYVSKNGHLPASFPTKQTSVGSLEDAYDLCVALVPEFIKDIPIDPLTGVKIDTESGEETSAPCNSDSVGYLSGYEVSTNTAGHAEVHAPFSENAAISAVSYK